MTPRVAVLGLGEAGGAVAAGLAAAGCGVRAWDPVVTAARRRVGPTRRRGGHGSGSRSEPHDSGACRRRRGERRVGARRRTGLRRPQHGGAEPQVRARRGDRATGAEFADVALLGPVPTQGIGTPALASGDGAERFAELVRPLGMPVEVVGDEPGDAAGLKLVRSVFMKGLAASVLESLDAAKGAARTRGSGEIAEIVGEPLLERLVSGTVTHAERRLDEMEAAVAYLEELGVEPRVSRAAAGWLEQLDRGRAPARTGAPARPASVSARPARAPALRVRRPRDLRVGHRADDRAHRLLACGSTEVFRDPPSGSPQTTRTSVPISIGSIVASESARLSFALYPVNIDSPTTLPSASRTESKFDDP